MATLAKLHAYGTQPSHPIAYFRGRKLTGKCLRLPEKYKGAVAQIKNDDQRQQDSLEMSETRDQADMEPLPAGQDLHMTSTFDEICIWTHGSISDSPDQYTKGVEEWLCSCLLNSKVGYPVSKGISSRSMHAIPFTAYGPQLREPMIYLNTSIHSSRILQDMKIARLTGNSTKSNMARQMILADNLAKMRTTPELGVYVNELFTLLVRHLDCRVCELRLIHDTKTGQRMDEIRRQLHEA
ncbi:hypothetical protein E4U55_006113 [Claviceps digitariae]|nr:hypothetical protein E4U55_006113 [Claviceps digitariae]